MTSSELQQRFDGVLTKLANGIDDLTTLDVVTIAGGDLSVILKAGAGGKEIKNAKELIEGQADVFALTHIDGDQDTVQYVKDDAALKSALFDLHLQAVKTAVENRSSVVKMLLDLITTLPK